MSEIRRDFFRRDPVRCARGLVGCVLRWDGCRGRIVETEAYSSKGDPACHTFFRPSARDFVDSHQAGDAYVYLNYGVHWLFNILVKSEEEAGFVLIRALEPLEGIGRMAKRRGTENLRLLCSGPGKLTQALGIRRDAHGSGFLDGGSGRGIEKSSCSAVVADPRVGISKGKSLLWRFTQPESSFLSKKPSQTRKLVKNTDKSV